ncbi:hypothetical protein [Agrobacterium tumefaciens]|uniref:hypothetical protein n=1 Tax=Agrobacterium tumefaciens TaxID=358 RepID=UPI003B9E9DAF
MKNSSEGRYAKSIPSILDRALASAIAAYRLAAQRTLFAADAMQRLLISQISHGNQCLKWNSVVFLSNAALFINMLPTKATLNCKVTVTCH